MGIKLDLNGFAEGALQERVNLELQKVLENIADPNTSATKVRKLTVTLKISADKKREIAFVDIESKCLLVPAESVATKIVLDRDGRGKVTGAELKSGTKGQTYFNDDLEVADDVGNVIEVEGTVVDFRKQKN